MKPKEDLDLIAAAAAKLVLQELDPAARRKRQEFNIGLPQGMLCIHAKSLRSINKPSFFSATFTNCTDLNIFLQISIQDIVKCSKIMRIRNDFPGVKMKQGANKRRHHSSMAQADHGTTASHTSMKMRHESVVGATNEIVLDELKTYSVELSPKREDPKNYLVFEIIAANLDQDVVKKGTKIGSASIHMYDLIKEMYGNKVIPISAKEKNLTFIDFEYVLRYGTLGYGYSHQLKQKEKSISHILSESMFFRLYAPLGRRDGDGFLVPSNKPKPKFIPFVMSAEEREQSSFHSHDSGSTKLHFQACDWQPECGFDVLYPFAIKLILCFLVLLAEEVEAEAVGAETEADSKEHTSNVTSLIQNRKRLGRMRREYLELTTRHDRTEYLQSLVARLGVTKAKGGLYSDDEDNEEERDEHSPHIVTERDEKTDPLKAMVDNLSPLLLMATGLRKRGQRPGIIRKRSFGNYMEIDETNDADVEDNSLTKKPTPTASTTGLSSAAASVTTLNDSSSGLPAKGLLLSLAKKLLAPLRFMMKTDSIDNPSSEVSSHPTVSDALNSTEAAFADCPRPSVDTVETTPSAFDSVATSKRTSDL